MLTMTYAKVSLVAGKTVTMSINGGGGGRWLSTHAPGFNICIHVYDHYFQTSLKLPGQLKPNCMWRLLGKEWHKFIKMVLPHDQDGCHAHLW